MSRSPTRAQSIPGIKSKVVVITMEWSVPLLWISPHMLMIKVSPLRARKFREKYETQANETSRKEQGRIG